jgi:hypothetical protein
MENQDYTFEVMCETVGCVNEKIVLVVKSTDNLPAVCCGGCSNVISNIKEITK